MTAVQFQACEELHSLEKGLFLQCQEFSWSLKRAVRASWGRQETRAVTQQAHGKPS